MFSSFFGTAKAAEAKAPPTPAGYQLVGEAVLHLKVISPMVTGINEGKVFIFKEEKGNGYKILGNDLPVMTGSTPLVAQPMTINFTLNQTGEKVTVVGDVSLKGIQATAVQVNQEFQLSLINDKGEMTASGFNFLSASLSSIKTTVLGIPHEVRELTVRDIVQYKLASKGPGL